MTKLRFVCPSCGAKLAAVEASASATQVVQRTCPNKDCRETWQLKVFMLPVGSESNGVRMDAAEFVFKGRRK